MFWASLALGLAVGIGILAMCVGPDVLYCPALHFWLGSIALLAFGSLVTCFASGSATRPT